MKRLRFLLPAVALAISFAPTQPKQEPALREMADTPGLPRVLLVGDSISMGYTEPVRKLLEDKANVHRILENGGPTSHGVENIDKWLGSGHWNVIHFNFGLHDLRRATTCWRAR